MTTPSARSSSQHDVTHPAAQTIPRRLALLAQSPPRRAPSARAFPPTAALLPGAEYAPGSRPSAPARSNAPGTPARAARRAPESPPGPAPPTPVPRASPAQLANPARSNAGTPGDSPGPSPPAEFVPSPVSSLSRYAHSHKKATPFFAIVVASLCGRFVPAGAGMCHFGKKRLHPGSFLQQWQTQDLEHTEPGRIYGTLKMDAILLGSG